MSPVNRSLYTDPKQRPDTLSMKPVCPALPLTPSSVPGGQNVLKLQVAWCLAFILGLHRLFLHMKLQRKHSSWHSQKSGTRREIQRQKETRQASFSKLETQGKPLNGWRKIRPEYKEINVLCWHLWSVKMQCQAGLLCLLRVVFQNKGISGIRKLRLHHQQTYTENLSWKDSNAAASPSHTQEGVQQIAMYCNWLFLSCPPVSE